MSGTTGKRTWIIPDGFLPEDSSGKFVSHEAVCVLNTGPDDAHLELTIYFEGRDPMRDFTARCPAERTRHIRLDTLENGDGDRIPTGVPYALLVESDRPVVIQHSRMDTTQAEMALMSTIAYTDGR